MFSKDHRLSSYQYQLPQSLIARKPAIPRCASKLMVLYRKTQKWEHRKFQDLPYIIQPESVFVANNTRVMKSRLIGNRIPSPGSQGLIGGNVEFLLLEKIKPLLWRGIVKASCKNKVGLHFQIPLPNREGHITGEIISTFEHLESKNSQTNQTTPTYLAQFDRDPLKEEAGWIPLPHYIKRKPEILDALSYQTIFSKETGSVAAPTAGLHFTSEMITSLQTRNFQWLELTHHIGLGTFRPVRSADIQSHQMHDENFEISPFAAERINLAVSNQSPIIAIGTTSVRSLESSFHEGKIIAGRKKTSLFIYPQKHQFQVVNHLITNFHLPGSTLLMLVSAFAGREFTLAAYQSAIDNKYRFYSYGDAMLIL